MVRQFADPYAFLRELVQNAVDAGTRSVTVRLDLGADGSVRTSVCDEGSGMSREIIEGPLLTLFSSSKENDKSKIGKYGVGFVSVFAVEPIAVEVATWRADASWRLTLRPDHSYELAHGEPRPKSGTVVTLSHQMDAVQFASHVAACRTALLRWCRHVRCPTELVVQGLAGDPEARIERVDRPLAVRSLASVTIEDPALELVLAIGCAVNPRGAAPLHTDAELSSHFAGFYNRGLTLYESSSTPMRGLERVRFKADSARLAHTLSRDDVRRDASFEAVLDRARAAVKNELRAEVARRLRELAAEVSAGGDAGRSANGPYLELLSAAARPPFSLDNDALAAPLTDPIRGKTTMSFESFVHRSAGEPLCAPAPDPLTAELARAGRPVVRLPTPVAAMRIRDVTAVDSEWTLVEELCPLPVDHPHVALLAAVSAVLLAADAPVARVGRCRTLGARTPAAVLVPKGSLARKARGDERRGDVVRTHLLHTAEVAHRWRAWEVSSALLIDVAQQPWLLATSAERHVSARGVLSARDNDRLLALSTEEPA